MRHNKSLFAKFFFLTASLAITLGLASCGEAPKESSSPSADETSDSSSSYSTSLESSNPSSHGSGSKSTVEESEFYSLETTTSSNSESDPYSLESSEPSDSNEIKYTVRRYTEGIFGGYFLFDEIERVGKKDTLTDYMAEEIEGFHFAPYAQIVPDPEGNNFVDIRYARNTYELSFRIWDNSLLLVTEGDVALAVYQEEITISSVLLDPSAEFLGWYDGDTLLDGNLDFTFSMPSHDLELVGRVQLPDVTRYEVHHILQNPYVEDGWYPPVSETQYGQPGESTNAKATFYAGYEAEAFSQGIISPDGNTLIEIRYFLRSFDIVIENKTGGGNAYVAGGSTNISGGTYVHFVAEPDEGYLFLGYYDEKGILFEKEGTFDYLLVDHGLHLYARFGKGDALYAIKHLYADEEHADSFQCELYTLEYKAGKIGGKTNAEPITINEYYGLPFVDEEDQKTITGNLAETIEFRYRYGYFALEIAEEGLPHPRRARWMTKMGSFVPVNAEPQDKNYELEAVFSDGVLLCEYYMIACFMPMKASKLLLSYGEISEERIYKIGTKENGDRFLFGVKQNTVTGDLRIPENIARIKSAALRPCYNVTSVELPFSGRTFEDTIGNVGTMFNGQASRARMSLCYQLKDLETAIFLNGCPSINGGSFTNCAKLRSVTIPESVTKIGETAFYHCRNLKPLTLPEGLTFIGEYAFALDKKTDPIALMYNGTTSQWRNQVQLEENWQDGSISAIICNNGTITL